MVYIAAVHRYLNKPLAESDHGFVWPFDDEPEVYEAETPTNKLVHVGPVENNVSVYRGIFATAEDAARAIRETFSHATVHVD